MSRPDEGLIHTWLDGECSAEEAARIEALVQTDPEWAAAVAEARGLIAASSRIVSALDAVPGGVIPAGSTAAPRAPSAPVRAHARVRPWMRMAAALVLVAGTAYALRTKSREPFATTVTPSVDGRANEGDSARAAVAETAGPNVAAGAGAGVAPAEDAAPLAVRSAAPEPVAPAASPAASPVPPPAPSPAPTAAGASALGTEQRREVLGERSRDFNLSGVVVTGVASAADAARPPAPKASFSPPTTATSTTKRGAAAPSAAAPAAQPDELAREARAADLPIRSQLLIGCWNVTAPDSLKRELRDPAILRASGDTLEILLTGDHLRRVRVVRNGDALGGEITAQRMECPAKP